MENQAYLFLIFVLNGFLIGILFDVFRILRKSFKTKDFFTYIEDILFWLISGGIILYTIFKFNNGELRAFIFIGLIIGSLLYMLLFSKTFIKINLYIINLFKKIIYFTLVLPIQFVSKLLRKILLKPISFIIINFRRTVSNFKIKVKNLCNNKKKVDCKKDFI